MSTPFANSNWFTSNHSRAAAYRIQRRFFRGRLSLLATANRFLQKTNMRTAEAAALRVLVLAPIGRELAGASADLLRRDGLTAEIVGDVDALVNNLRLAPAPYLLRGSAIGADLTTLEFSVRGQSAWSDLPFVVSTSHTDQPKINFGANSWLTIFRTSPCWSGLSANNPHKCLTSCASGAPSPAGGPFPPGGTTGNRAKARGAGHRSNSTAGRCEYAVSRSDDRA